MSEFTQMAGDEMQQWLDRLVDGQLDVHKQQRLLAELGSRPDDWRRCALAFVEAQVWRKELSALADRATPVEAHRREMGRANFARRWGTLAAGLLIAFGLGAAAGRVPLAASTAEQKQVASSSMPDAVDEARQAIEVTLPTAGGSGSRTVEVPVVEADEEMLADMLAGGKSISSDVRTALEQLGHRVEFTRAYYPVRLEDGREAVLPLDLVELQSRGGWQ